MGGATIGKLPSGSSLRKVMSSSPCFTFTRETGVSLTVPIEDQWDLTSSVDVAITESLTPYTRIYQARASIAWNLHHIETVQWY
jgi:hypothetical protein